MINLVFVKKCCKDYTKIDNYEEAVNDTTQTWICHHILGEILSREQLEAHDFYYNVPSCMLKFVTWSEHARLHKQGRTLSEEHRRKLSESLKGHTVSEKARCKMSEARKGKSLSEETRRKMSESLKGENNPFFGQQHSAESRKKMSEAKKGKTLSEEHRRKISEAAKRRCTRKEEKYR